MRATSVLVSALVSAIANGYSIRDDVMLSVGLSGCDGLKLTASAFEHMVAKHEATKEDAKKMLQEMRRKSAEQRAAELVAQTEELSAPHSPGEEGESAERDAEAEGAAMPSLSKPKRLQDYLAEVVPRAQNKSLDITTDESTTASSLDPSLSSFGDEVASAEGVVVEKDVKSEVAKAHLRKTHVPNVSEKQAVEKELTSEELLRGHVKKMRRLVELRNNRESTDYMDARFKKHNVNEEARWAKKVEAIKGSLDTMAVAREKLRQERWQELKYKIKCFSAALLCLFLLICSAIAFANN